MITEKEFEVYRTLKYKYLEFIETKIKENCSKIVQIGAFTAELNEVGKVVLSQTKFPYLFNEDTALRISYMNWVSKTGRKPTLEILNAKDWYQKRVEAFDSILSLSKFNV